MLVRPDRQSIGCRADTRGGEATRTEVLRQVDLFGGVDDETLVKLLAAGRRMVVRAGHTVVRQGEYGDTFYVILEGEAAVRVTAEDGKSREVGRLGPGRYFGEMAMLGRGERRASVQAVTSAELLELRRVHLDQTLRRFKSVRTRLEQTYTRGVVEAFIRQGRYFRELPAPMLDQLAQAATLASFSKDDVIVREGDPAQRLHIVRSGFVRISRRAGEGEEILAYLGPEDFFGDEEVVASAPHGASAVAVEPVECVVVPRSAVWGVYLRHPEVFQGFRRYSLARSAKQSSLLSSQTAVGFVRDVLEAGLGQARSALIINLDACVRCGNCVQACDDLHGYSRLARRGKKLTRRVELDSHRHENLYFPTSCLQCATPECMVGCPTGAIARDAGGEVYIKDTCIGCGSCARNCDFGNIAMASVEDEAPSLVDLVLGQRGARAAEAPGAPERGATVAGPQKARADLVAVKCDVCFEREFAACVYNCPVEAVLRIDPRTYFEELRQIAPRASIADAPAARTTTRRPNRWIDPVVQAGALLGAVAASHSLHARLSPSSWHGPGWAAGVGALVGVLALGAMGARKRLRTQRLGALAAWARAHAVLGGLVYGAVLFHAGFRATSLLTATLLALLTVSVVVGFAGQLASAIIPRLLARSEDEALLPEDVAPRVKALEDASRQLLEALDERARARVEAHARRMLDGGLSYVWRGLGPRALAAELQRRAKRLPALVEREHAVALRVAENLATVRLFGARRALEVLLTSWVPLHLASSALALMLLLGHLMTVALW